MSLMSPPPARSVDTLWVWTDEGLSTLMYGSGPTLCVRVVLGSCRRFTRNEWVSSMRVGRVARRWAPALPALPLPTLGRVPCAPTAAPPDHTSVSLPVELSNCIRADALSGLRMHFLAGEGLSPAILLATIRLLPVACGTNHKVLRYGTTLLLLVDLATSRST